MLLVLQKDVFIENEASQQCVTMRKRFSTIMATIWFNSLLKYLSCRKLKCVTPLQSAITRKREAPQPHVLIFFLISSIFSEYIYIYIYFSFSIFLFYFFVFLLFLFIYLFILIGSNGPPYFR